MSFTRYGQDSDWFEESDFEGIYCYPARSRIVGLPTTEPEFAELVMVMLEQSNHDLDEETLEAVRDALKERLHF